MALLYLQTMSRLIEALAPHRRPEFSFRCAEHAFVTHKASFDGRVDGAKVGFVEQLLAQYRGRGALAAGNKDALRQANEGLRAILPREDDAESNVLSWFYTAGSTFYSLSCLIHEGSLRDAREAGFAAYQATAGEMLDEYMRNSGRSLDEDDVESLERQSAECVSELLFQRRLLEKLGQAV